MPTLSRDPLVANERNVLQWFIGSPPHHANTQQNRTVKSHCKFKVKGQYKERVNHRKDIIYFQACWDTAALEIIKK